MHLDRPTYAGLLAGTLPPEEARALADHLSRDCEECERFLAELQEADALDGRIDAAIAAALPFRPMPPNDLEFARIEERLRDPRASHRARHRPFLVPAAIAASILVAGLAGLLLQRKPASHSFAAWDGVKGSEARPLRVRLRIARLDASGEPVRGQPGETLDRGAKLLFELELDRAADVALARATPNGEVEVVWRNRVAGGRTIVTQAGRAAAYPLGALAGTQRFVAVAAEGGLDAARLSRATAAFAAPGLVSPDSPALSGLSVDFVEITVR